MKYFKRIIKKLFSKTIKENNKILISPIKKKNISYDLFLSYSSSDRKAIVNPLYKKLISTGFNPWLDIKKITWGDSIIEKMQDGISNTKFIIFFISKSYLDKPWTLKELRSILAMQVSNDLTILPILLGISEKELIQFVPFLADIKHIKIDDYNSKGKIEEKYFQEIIYELRIAIDKIAPIKLKKFSHIHTSSEPIKITSIYYDITSSLPYYRYYVVTSNKIIKINELTFRHSKIKKITSNLISCSSEIEDTFLTLSDNTISIERTSSVSKTTIPIHSLVSCVSKPFIKLNDFSILFFVGYEDGSIYTSNRKENLLTNLKFPIIAIDISLESILVAVSQNGEIGIWLRNTYKLKKYIKIKNSITSLAVSKTRVNYNNIFLTGHTNGTVAIWDFNGMNINEYHITEESIVALSLFPNELEYVGIVTKNNFIILNILTGIKVLIYPHNDGNITTLDIGNLHLFSSYFDVIVGCDNGKVFTWRLVISK